MTSHARLGTYPAGHIRAGHLPPGHLPPGHLPPRTYTPYRSGRQIGDLKLVFLDHFQTIFHNFPDMLSMILVNTLFKSYDFACTIIDMPLCSKWNVFVPYDSKAAGNLRKVAEMRLS